VQFGTVGMAPMNQKRLGTVRVKKDVNDVGLCLRGYDRVGLRDIFVYFTSIEEKEVVMAELM
jgi:hypothetical protein